MKQTLPDFSIILATYTGVDVIEDCLNSLLSQYDVKQKYELIVVIDGPNTDLLARVKEAAKSFEVQGIEVSINQFKRNKGRFEARLFGAKKAKNEFLLFMDDRVVLPSDFLKTVSSLGEGAVMPDVEEALAKNFVSFTLNRMRRRIYGHKWGGHFEPYYIESHNFDYSPKGTAAFWIEKQSFVNACEKIAKSIRTQSGNISDDTRVLMELVNNGIHIYKSSDLKLVYSPRSSAWEEVRHIFQRGPKFVDYYLHPGRRFFLPLIFFYISLMAAIIIFVLYPTVIILLLAISLLTAFYLTDEIKNIVRVWFGCWLIGLSFGFGLIRGLFGFAH